MNDLRNSNTWQWSRVPDDRILNHIDLFYKLVTSNLLHLASLHIFSSNSPEATGQSGVKIPAIDAFTIIYRYI